MSNALNNVGKVETVFNVKEARFGARGDGSTNDTTALQAAINAAQLINGTVVIPSGVYLHDGLTISNNITVVGDDQIKTVLRTRAGTNAHGITVVQGDGVVGNPVIENLTIDGNRAGNASTGSCIFLPDSAILDATLFYGFSVVLRNMNVINGRDACLYVGKNRNMGDCYNVEFKRGARCIYIDGSSDWRFFHPRIAFPLAGHGLHINSGADNTFLGGAAYGALDGYACIKIESGGSQPTKFIAMTVNDNQNEAIWIKGPTGVARHMGVFIEGCWFDQNSKAGTNVYSCIKIEDSQGNSIIGNTFRHVGGGIQVKHLVEFTGATGPVEWVGNSYDSITNIPFGTSVTNSVDSLRARIQRLVVEGATSLGGTPGGEALRVQATGAASSNFVQVQGAAAGNPAAIISAQGADTNVVLRIAGKGTGAVELQSSGVRQARALGPASAVNFVDITGATTNNPVVVSANGSDTNVDLSLSPRGTSGRVRYGTFVSNADAPVVGYIEIKDSGGNLRKLAIIA